MLIVLVFVLVQVPYNISNWLEKNKDPMNECMITLLGQSKEKLVQELFPQEAGDTTGKKKKSASFATISNTHRVREPLVN